MDHKELSLVCFEDFESAAELKSVWNELAADNPMLSWCWMKHWWNHLGVAGGIERSLALTVVKNQAGRTIGIAPLYVSSNLVCTNLRFIGDGMTCTDYIDILAKPEDCEAVGQQLAQWIQSPDFQNRYGQLDAIVFEGLNENATGIQSLERRLIEAKWKKNENRLESSWCLDLRNGFVTLCQQLHHSQKRKVKKALKRQQQGELDLEVIDSVQTFYDDWHDFVILHQKRRNFLKQPGCFVDGGFDQFLCETTRELMTQGKAKIVFLVYQNRRIAANLLFFSEDWVFNYQNGSDPDYLKLEPGHALNALAIAWSCQQGYKAFDFLRGDEHYKKIWGAEPERLFRYRLIAPRWSARAKETFRQSAKIVRDQSRSWLQNVANQMNPTQPKDRKEQPGEERELENASQHFVRS